MNTQKWDSRFLKLAFVVASFSKDKEQQVGAVLVSKDRRQLAIGYNGLPRFIDDSKELSLQEKLALSVHAEMNCILNCAVDTTGWTIYTTKFPCIDCAKHIVQAGIAAVVVGEPLDNDSKWLESQQKAKKLFTEAKVIVYDQARKRST